MKNLNRVVAVTSALISLALAVLPVVLNFDWTSTAGCIGGIVAVLGITQKWLDGWQKHEERQWIAANPHLVAQHRPEVIPIVLNNNKAETTATTSIDDEEGDPVHPLAQNYEEADPATLAPDRGNPQAAADAGGAS